MTTCALASPIALVLRCHLRLRRQLGLALGHHHLLLERLDLLLGDFALVDQRLDLFGRDDIAHQRLADDDPLLAHCVAKLRFKLLLELQLGIAADEIAGVVLASDNPAEAAGVRQNHLLFDKFDQLAAFGILHINERQILRIDLPFDKSIELDVEANRWTGSGFHRRRSFQIAAIER